MTGAWDKARVVQLARQLRGVETGGWSGPALRAVVEGLGWQWHEGTAGPRLVTGTQQDASPEWAPRLRPVDRFEKDYVHGGEEYVGLYVPVAVPGGGAAGKAAAFRAVGEALTEEFGPASIMGV
ncbi:hypothetical protein HCK01_35635, partial [Streptomyces sp. AA8]|nr:hypothetical protein [Streptomyces telluris]